MTIEFATSLNLSRAEIRTLENLTQEQLIAIRRNVRVSTDQGAFDAAAQYLADDGDLVDLLAEGGKKAAAEMAAPIEQLERAAAPFLGGPHASTPYQCAEHGEHTTAQCPQCVSTTDRFARVVDQGNGKIVTLTPEQKKLFADVLVSRYPQLATDEELDGSDAVDTLNELYADLCDADQSFVVAVQV